MESFEERLRRAASPIMNAKCTAAFTGTSHRTGAKLIFINRTETFWDRIADVRFGKSAAEVMGGVMDVLGGC